MTDKRAHERISDLLTETYRRENELRNRLEELEKRVKLMADAHGVEFVRIYTDGCPFPPLVMRNKAP